MDNAFVAQNFCRFAEIIAHVALRTNPIKITAESFFQIHLRNITGSPDPFCAADKMPHLSGPKLAIDFRREPYSERIRNSLLNFGHANSLAASYIHGPTIEQFRFFSDYM